MTSICVDTSFLISFADKGRPNHQAAMEYFRYAVENEFRICLSTLVIAEFEVKQRITDLPLSNFEVVPFSARHAVEAAKFHRTLTDLKSPDDGPRHVVRNDLKILAQAELEGCQTVLGEDSNTLTRWTEKLHNAGHTQIRSILLKNGFLPEELNDPNQKGLNLGS